MRDGVRLVKATAEAAGYELWDLALMLARAPIADIRAELAPRVGPAGAATLADLVAFLEVIDEGHELDGQPRLLAMGTAEEPAPEEVKATPPHPSLSGEFSVSWSSIPGKGTQSHFHFTLSVCECDTAGLRGSCLVSRRSPIGLWITCGPLPEIPDIPEELLWAHEPTAQDCLCLVHASITAPTPNCPTGPRRPRELLVAWRFKRHGPAIARAMDRIDCRTVAEPWRDAAYAAAGHDTDPLGYNYGRAPYPRPDRVGPGAGGPSGGPRDAVYEEFKAVAARAMKEEGNRLFSLGKWMDAIREYQGARGLLLGWGELSARPDMDSMADLKGKGRDVAVLCSNLAAARGKLGHFGAAAEEAEAAAEADPGWPKAHFRYGCAQEDRYRNHLETLKVVAPHESEAEMLEHTGTSLRLLRNAAVEYRKAYDLSKEQQGKGDKEFRKAYVRVTEEYNEKRNFHKLGRGGDVAAAVRQVLAHGTLDVSSQEMAEEDWEDWKAATSSAGDSGARRS